MLPPPPSPTHIRARSVGHVVADDIIMTLVVPKKGVSDPGGGYSACASFDIHILHTYQVKSEFT